MGIFKRIWNWICSLFSGRKDDTKDFTAYVRQMEEALRNMKAQTQAILAAEEKRKREAAQCQEQIEKMARYAAKAADQGDDGNARFFLEKKAVLEHRLEELRKKSEAAAGYTAQAEALYQRSQSQLEEITARKDAIQAKMAQAQLVQSIGELENSSWNQTLRGQAEEAQRALDKAEAMAELEERGADGDLAALDRHRSPPPENRKSPQSYALPDERQESFLLHALQQHGYIHW